MPNSLIDSKFIVRYPAGWHAPNALGPFSYNILIGPGLLYPRTDASQQDCCESDISKDTNP